MSLFNFKLSKDSFIQENIKLDINNLPEDYHNFLLHYQKVCPINEYQDICIKILNESISIIMYTIPEFLLDKNEDNFWPKKYLAIAGDYEFQSVIMCITGENRGHIYYMDFETWQTYVLDKDEEVQLTAIKEHAIHVANSFTEFTHKLYLED